ncbi:constitutive low affinity CO2 uptake protein [cyanobacterium endosymbiont of Rhopalodia gibberula]|uniref:CO2 hydration protein n=1 Tax=cyanobacterium endosymbiont of Rhopalodia gibberula TaxID=1763363 RepID=UPI000DC720C3|nr:CO2 hydration protein [cyanobacterium endosymbiont of Rhopalodia gibberula]BBA79416.1 constitutive low affinity CO2 uptake protein [cyanobacterium endosymbiont of Rhopalodia gibberula]
MVTIQLKPSCHPLAEYIYRLEQGEALLKNSSNNVLEVVGILKSYGMILDAYSRNLIYIAENQFLIIFPFFKYFNGEVSFQKLLNHWSHDRINFEYAEYCMKSMMWHGGGGLDRYLDTPEFKEAVKQIIKFKFKNNFLMLTLDKIFPEFLPEQIRMMSYYSGLGQFWRVMADIFLSLSDRYDREEIKSISQVVKHISDGLVKNANKPIAYRVIIFNKGYDIIPKSVGLTFLPDTAVPYIESIFFRGTPFLGTISYNAQAYQIPQEQDLFTYGALYADPLSVGCAGIPPTLLMQDIKHYLPNYLYQFYQNSIRQEDDLLVKICHTFQKSMFCVMTAAIKELAPYSLNTTKFEEKKVNRAYLEMWMDRFLASRLLMANQ